MKFDKIEGYRDENNNLLMIHPNNIKDGVLAISEEEIKSDLLGYKRYIDNVNLLYAEAIRLNDYMSVANYDAVLDFVKDKVLSSESKFKYKELDELNNHMNKFPVRKLILDVAGKINVNAFANCLTIQKAKLINVNNNIGLGLFNGCHNLNECIINGKLENIPDIMFYNSALENFNFDKDTKSIGIGSFKNTALPVVEVNDELECIGDEAFMGCKRLYSVNLKNVKVIGDRAFYNCGLRELRLPHTLEHLGIGAFDKNPNLKNVYLPINIDFYNPNNIMTDSTCKSFDKGVQMFYIPDIYKNDTESLVKIKRFLNVALNKKGRINIGFYSVDDEWDNSIQNNI